MKLAEYLDETHTSCGELAERIGVPPSTVWRIRQKLVDPRASTALAIIRATRRRVKLEDLVPDAD